MEETDVRFGRSGSDVFVDQAQRLFTDIPVGNGAIRVIDAVRMP